MLHSAATHLALTQYCSTLGVYHVLGNGIHDGLTGHVDALYLVSVVGRSRHEGHCEGESSVQSFAAQ